MSHLLQNLRRRELCGFGGYMSHLNSSLYSKITTAGGHNPASGGSLGAVFNVEFSPRGHVLVTVCEECALQIWDPQTHQCMRTVLRAHTDCVNCVKFLDDRLFATCSDDKSVRLWDLRNLSKPVLTLSRHRGWVKSIEFDTSTKLLITASFDDTVRLWDINSSADHPTQGEIIFQHNLITRVKLAPDNSKLCLASHALLIVIHNLDLRRLQEEKTAFGLELSGRPNQFNHVNSTEEIIAWPHEPFLISSLQVFPDSNRLMSRYTTLDEESEWLCVHDLQSMRAEEEESVLSISSNSSSSNSSVNSDASMSSSGEAQFSSLGANLFSPERDEVPPASLVHYSSLLSYTEEANVEDEIIKEPGISSDGRVICSPFGNGLRLLKVEDYDQDVEEDRQPGKLEEIQFLLDRQSPLLTARFSPTQLLVASGSMDGAVLFYQPKLG